MKNLIATAIASVSALIALAANIATTEVQMPEELGTVTYVQQPLNVEVQSPKVIELNEVVIYGKAMREVQKNAKVWACGEPRQLVQGRGNVKVCEWQ